MDLSGTMQGAGGVGGLLAVRVHDGEDAGDYYPAFDGNGNVTEYLDDEGTVQAHYEYDPFGRDITPEGNEGDLHDLFTHRFSTKQLDSVTGWYYYGYRWCAPSEAWRLLQGASPCRKRSEGGSLKGKG